jgi:molybdopterin molybdotransferase
MRARLSHAGATAQVEVFERQDSALLSVLAQANALVIRPVKDPARAAGEIVDVLVLP